VTSDFRTNFHAYSEHYGVGWLQKAVIGYLRRFHNKTLVTMVPTWQQRLTLSNLGFESLEVVARGVDTSLFSAARRNEELRRSWGAGPLDPVVISVGRLAPEKNLASLSAAFGAVKLRRPNAKLVLVGDGPSREAMRRHHPHAIFAGTQCGERLAACYASADLFLFPSLTETFGNVTLEAMASGLAVLAYNYAAAAAHIRHRKNGFLAAYGDGAEFCRLASAIVADVPSLRAVGAAAGITAQQLDWERVVCGLEALFISVAETARICRGINFARTGRTPLQNINPH
jgi:glycosyltransferase involved in cell wall biosynthesis